jgi:hypothetical protein
VKVTYRKARREELTHLQRRLAEKRDVTEIVPLGEGIVFVAEYENKIVGFGAAQMYWKIEPVMLFDEFKKKAPRSARQRATYLLARALDHWIKESPENTSGVRRYYCFIRDRVMQKLAQSFGMFRIYTGGKFFGR